MKISLIAFTKNGGKICKKIESQLTKDGNLCTAFALGENVKSKGLIPVEDSLSQWTKSVFYSEEALVFVGASGIAMRAVAPYIRDKRTDPAVIVVDEKGKFVIPFLSGHIGGGNRLATRIAEITKGIPIITTATDINNKFAVDVWATEKGFLIDDMKMAKRISAELLAERHIGFYSEYPIQGALPTGFFQMEKREVQLVGSGKQAGNCVILSHKSFGETENLLQLIPKTVFVGMGCRKGILLKNVNSFLNEILEKYGIRKEAIASISSIDLKKEEEGLCLLAEHLGVPFITYSAEQLDTVEGDFTSSEFVKKTTGVDNVCERAAIMGSWGGKLISKKEVRDGITIAIAIKATAISFE